MGIRYYAYPVHAADIDNARADPWAYLSDDPLLDAWGPPEQRPRMLYLDKCWQELQQLLSDNPALAMVEGEVIHTQDGWISHKKVLAPEELPEIAEGLALVTEDDVLALAESQTFRETEEQRSYIQHYLSAARTFADELRDEGLGLIYLIG
ncbi:MAG: hypothetical protein JWR04_101 [Rhodoglobus sp.]|nr:hypothetical protein [Rhodoglobus sp.]